MATTGLRRSWQVKVLDFGLAKPVELERLLDLKQLTSVRDLYTFAFG